MIKRIFLIKYRLRKLIEKFLLINFSTCKERSYNKEDVVLQWSQNLKDGSEYDNLYAAAKSRSEADWLVGINASHALDGACRGLGNPSHARDGTF